MIQVLFNCDDFGRNHEVNQAVLRAHREGVLGSASLMVSGSAVDEAVQIAREHPRLKVGLHLVLCDGVPVMAPSEIPRLVDTDGMLHADPAKAGIRMAFDVAAKAQTMREIEAQFKRFADTGLIPAHVDGHHHLHMHPFVFRECVKWASKGGFQRIRVVREFGDPLPIRRDGVNYFSKLIRHGVFVTLAGSACSKLAGTAIDCFDGVVGLWETGKVNEAYLLSVISRITEGRWEIYNHVGAPGAEGELQAMLSERVRGELKRRHIQVLGG